MLLCKEKTGIIEIMVIKIKLRFRYAKSPKFCWFYKHNTHKGSPVVPKAAEFNSGRWDDLVSGNRNLQGFKIWYHYKCAQIHYRTEILKKYIFALSCFTIEVYVTAVEHSKMPDEWNIIFLVLLSCTDSCSILVGTSYVWLFIDNFLTATVG